MLKVVADSVARILFTLFTMIDGVSEPVFADADSWLGLTVQMPRVGDKEPDMMFHDAFLDTYNDYVAILDARNRPPT